MVGGTGRANFLFRTRANKPVLKMSAISIVARAVLLAHAVYFVWRRIGDWLIYVNCFDQNADEQSSAPEYVSWAVLKWLITRGVPR